MFPQSGTESNVYRGVDGALDPVPRAEADGDRYFGNGDAPDVASGSGEDGEDEDDEGER